MTSLHSTTQRHKGLQGLQDREHHKLHHLAYGKEVEIAEQGITQSHTHTQCLQVYGFIRVLYEIIAANTENEIENTEKVASAACVCVSCDFI